MFGCYRKGDANDPETYTAAVAAVLAQYPPDVVTSVTDPRSGLPGRMQWLPTVKEVRDACEAIVQRSAAADERVQQGQRQLETRAESEKPRERLTAEQMKEKYGANYGLARDDEGHEKAKALKSAVIMRGNSRSFEAECRAAGVDPTRATVSPSLAADIVEYRQKMEGWAEDSEREIDWERAR